MTKIIGHSKSGESRPQKQTEQPFQLMLMHDGEIARAEARRMINPLLTKSLTGFDVHCDELTFSEIAHPEICSEAAELAEGCDLFLLATVNGMNLPGEIVAWLHRWFEARQKKDAAVVCLVGTMEEAMLESPVQLYLQRLAGEHNLAFFSRAFTMSREQIKRSIETRAVSPGMRQVMDRCCPRPERWGINE